MTNIILNETNIFNERNSSMHKEIQSNINKFLSIGYSFQITET